MGGGGGVTAPCSSFEKDTGRAKPLCSKDVEILSKTLDVPC